MRTLSKLPGVERRIALLTRKTIDQLESFQALRDQLLKAAQLGRAWRKLATGRNATGAK